MKKIDNILYLTDDTIYLKNKKIDNIIKYKINDGIVNNGKVININKFINTYEKLINTNRINNSLFGETIKVIVPNIYSNADILVLKNILETFNYRKIFIDLESKYYKLNNDNAYINIQNNYMLLYYLDEYKKMNVKNIPSNFFSNMKDTMNYISKLVNNKDLYLIGKGELFQDFFNKFESIYKIKTYMFTDNELYLINASK